MFYSNHLIYWNGFYDFILNELFEEEIPNYQSFIEYNKALEHIHSFIPFKDIVFISDNPVELNLNSDGRLSHIDKPAMMYEDGYSLFYINGVKIDKKFIEIPKEEIKSEDVLAIQNAEERMQVMKKVGLGRFFDSLEKKTIDKQDDYELMLVKLNDEDCEFLKMVNPSTGEIHLEGVAPNTKTVSDALAWRNGLEYWINPLQLT